MKKIIIYLSAIYLITSVATTKSEQIWGRQKMPYP